MDGSAKQAGEGDIGENGHAVKSARRATGGVARGQTSTKMMLPY